MPRTRPFTGDSLLGNEAPVPSTGSGTSVAGSGRRRLSLSKPPEPAPQLDHAVRDRPRGKTVRHQAARRGRRRPRGGGSSTGAPRSWHPGRSTARRAGGACVPRDADPVQGAGDGTRWASPPREPGAGGPEHRVPGSRSAAPASAQRRGDAPGSGAQPRATLSATEPVTSPSLARPGDRAARVRNWGPSMRTEPSYSANPAPPAISDDLPTPLGPVTSTISPGSTDSDTSGSTCPSRRTRTRSSVRTDPRAGVSASASGVVRAASQGSKISSVAATPLARGVELHPHLPQRQVRHRASRRTNSPPAARGRVREQAEPDRHGDDGDRDGSQNSSAKPERNDTRRTVIARACSRASPLRWSRRHGAGDRRPFSVPSRRTVSAKRAASRPSVRYCFCCTPRWPGDQHHEQRDERIVSTTVRPESGSARVIAPIRIGIVIAGWRPAEGR